MSDELFEGAIINGKKFPFIRVTVASEPKIIDKFLLSTLSIMVDKYFPLTANRRAWHRVRAIAFQKDWRWKYFRIIPKELRDSELPINIAGGIQVDFFDYVTEKRQEFNALFPSAKALQTKSGATKPDA